VTAVIATWSGQQFIHLAVGGYQSIFKFNNSIIFSRNIDN